MSTPVYLPQRFAFLPPDQVGDPDVFPRLPGRAWGVKKTPVWNTSVKRTASGRELRTAYSTFPVWRFELSHEFLRDNSARFLAERTALVDFFNAHAGQGTDFYYFDREENQAPRQAFSTGDGNTRAFRLMRAIGGGRFREPVLRVVGAPTVWVNGTDTTAQATISADGIVVFNQAPAAGALLEWAGTFLFRCRFLADDFAVVQDRFGLFVPAAMAFQSVKP